LAIRLENFYRVDVQVRAEIGGQSVPVNSVSVRYSIDRIPEAAITIPVGRSARGDAVHVGAGVFGTLPPFTSMRIYALAEATPAGRDAPRKGGLPQGEFLLFDGYVSAPSMHLDVSGGMGSATLRVQGFGRLGGLAGATTLGVGVTLNKPPGGTDVFMSSFGQNEKNNHLTITDQLMKKGYYRDIGEAVLELFDDALNVTSVWAHDQPGSANAGAAADRAHASLVSGASFDLLKRASQVNQQAFGRMVAETLANVFWGVWSGVDKAGNFSPSAGGDLWEVMQKLQGVFYFHVVPTAATDYMAPITPNLGGDPNNLFPAGEYSIIGGGEDFFEGGGARYMYAYITQVGLAASSFQSSPWNDGSSVTGRVGYANLSLGDEDFVLDGGRIFMCGSPPWLIPAGSQAKDTLNPFKGISDAAGSGGWFSSGKRASEIAMFGSTLGDRVARTILHELVFEHRKLAVAGRLRTDVAPGNIVRVTLPAEGFIGQPGDNLYGMASDVILRIMTQEGGSLARTEVGISHLRTESEHERLTLDEHPVYGETWSGVPLVVEES